MVDRNIESNPVLKIRNLMFGSISTHAVAAAVNLKIPDELAEKPLTASDVATRLGLHAGAVSRLFRFLASVDVLELQDDDSYGLTEAGELLRSDIPESYAGLAQIFGAESGALTLTKLDHAVRTGEPAFAAAHGMELFEYMQPRPERRKLFHTAFTSMSRSQAPVIAEAFDFNVFDTIVDIGGGYGFLLIEILKRNAHPNGILYDLEKVVEDAQPLVEAEGLAGRCEILAGDFFKTVPHGADAYVMKLILHDWDDEQSTKLLANCEDALADGGRIIAIDMVIPTGPDFGLTLAADLNMMAVTGGQERTKEEFESLADSAGLQVDGITPTATGLSVIEMSRA